MLRWMNNCNIWQWGRYLCFLKPTTWLLLWLSNLISFGRSYQSVNLKSQLFAFLILVFLLKNFERLFQFPQIVYFYNVLYFNLHHSHHSVVAVMRSPMPWTLPRHQEVSIVQSFNCEMFYFNDAVGWKMVPMWFHLSSGSMRRIKCLNTSHEYWIKSEKIMNILSQIEL